MYGVTILMEHGVFCLLVFSIMTFVIGLEFCSMLPLTVKGLKLLIASSRSRPVTSC